MLFRSGAILAIAAELFARKGIDATTVREIADGVGMLSGSLYGHFESKDDMVKEILTGYLQAIQVRYARVLASGKSPDESLRDLVLTSLQVASEQPEATAIYQREMHFLRDQSPFGAVMVGVADVQRTWLEVIEEGVAAGCFRSDIDPRVFYRLIRDAVWLSVRWYQPGGESLTSQLAEDITAVFLNGVRRPPPVTRRRSGRRRDRCGGRARL